MFSPAGDLVNVWNEFIEVKLSIKFQIDSIDIFIILVTITAQKMKFSIRDFFSKYDQILRKARIWSHLLKKFLMKNFYFCVVQYFCLPNFWTLSKNKCFSTVV